MSELARAAASSGGVASAASGVVRSSALDFGQSGSFFEDFISILPNEAVQVPIRSVIARGTTQHDNRSAVRSGGNYFQRKHVWQATIKGITVWELRRPLERLHSGSLKPNGEWFSHGATEYESTGTPVRRHGVVPFDKDRIVHKDDKTARLDEQNQLDPEVLSFLPSVVQRYVMSHVNNPVFTQGEIWQRQNTSGIPYRQSIEIIRLGEDKAVVITAFKEISARGQDANAAQEQLSSHPWTITQSTFALRKASRAQEIGR